MADELKHGEWTYSVWNSTDEPATLSVGSDGDEVDIANFDRWGGDGMKVYAELIIQACNRAPAFEAMKEALEMVAHSIFQDSDGEWQLSRPADFLKVIADEALARTGE